MAMTSEHVKAFLGAEVSGSVQIKNEGWYSAAFDLWYTLQGNRIHVRITDITIGVTKSAPIPEGATDIALVVEEWWGFGWSTIFTKNWPAPARFCAVTSGTTLNTHWKEVPCDK